MKNCDQLLKFIDDRVREIHIATSEYTNHGYNKEFLRGIWALQMMQMESVNLIYSYLETHFSFPSDRTR